MVRCIHTHTHTKQYPDSEKVSVSMEKHVLNNNPLKYKIQHTKEIKSVIAYILKTMTVSTYTDFLVLCKYLSYKIENILLEPFYIPCC